MSYTPPSEQDEQWSPEHEAAGNPDDHYEATRYIPTQYDEQQYEQSYDDEQYDESAPYAEPAYAEGQYGPQEYPQNAPVPTGLSQDQIWRRRIQAIVGIAAILFLAAGAVVGIIYLRSDSKDEQQAAAGSSTSEARPASTPGGQASTPPQPTTPSASESASPTSADTVPAPDYSDPDWPAKTNSEADTGGWLASPFARCDSGGVAVMLLQTASFKIAVCATGDVLSYHGWRIGSDTGIVLDASFDGTNYVALNEDTTYTVGDSGVTVTNETTGETSVQEEATQIWYATS